MSLPPSHEEDIARRKAKGKERDDRFEHTPSSTGSTSSEHVDEMAYPPTSEDIEETRRVEEASPSLIALSPV
jgi:hypothetical protein